MNEMELLWQRAQETPLAAPADLDAARARLVAAIAADPAAGCVPAAADLTTSQPGPSSGPSAGSRPVAPAPVQAAVKLMWGGAAATAVQLIFTLFFIGDLKAYHLTVFAYHLTTAQLSHWRPLIATLVIAFGLAVIALWLWMARVIGQGRSWARVLSTVLAALATLELSGDHGAAQVFIAWLTWLTGLAAVWLLWRPASTAFFRSAAVARSRPPSQISGPE